MHLKFIPLGIVASFIASASARSLYTERSVGDCGSDCGGSNGHHDEGFEFRPPNSGGHGMYIYI